MGSLLPGLIYFLPYMTFLSVLLCFLNFRTFTSMILLITMQWTWRERVQGSHNVALIVLEHIV